jgi:peptidoglycan/xylan/chitin deacetylase (PgdA/CDA1 family)
VIAVLTWHRVGRAHGTPSVYDVEPGVFARQMNLLGSRTLRMGDGLVWTVQGVRVCLTFDDGTADHLRVGEELAARGVPATFFVVARRLDVAGHLARRDVARLAALGHRIGSHGVTHRRLPRLAPAVRRAELEDSRRGLEDLAGTTVDWFAPPGGAWSAACSEAAREAGYEVVRTMRWGYADFPLAGVVPSLPMRRNGGLAAFERAIGGRTQTWPYRAKEAAKAALGEPLYLRLRERWVGP